MTSEFPEEFKTMAKKFGYDFSMEGKRVRLIHTNDPFTSLQAGDTGTIIFKHWSYDCFVIQVEWDNGSSLGLIEGRDNWEIIEKKEVNID